MIPYFFRHYRSLVDHFYVFDNGSTDGSLDLLRGDERVSVSNFECRGDSFVAQERALSDSLWRRSRAVADWVVMIDMDEHLYHSDFRAYLAQCGNDQVTAIRSIGYEMVSDRFPTEAAPLYRQVTRGARSLGHDKLCVFNPNAISRTNFGLGRHSAAPLGRVTWPRTPELAMLHYKYLGFDYVTERNRVLAPGLRPRDLQMSWGTQYLRSHTEVAGDMSRIHALAGPVPELSGSADGTQESSRNEQILERSGLFQPAYYLAQNPDVSLAGVDPLVHYHLFGWREGRRPNPHFDPFWYLNAYGDALQPPTDPLLDYVNQGERFGRRPCQSFDPAAYRRAHGIGEDESPLRHFLQHQQSLESAPTGPTPVQWTCLADMQALGG